MTRHLRITVDGKPYDVFVEDVTEDAGSTFYQTPSVGMPRVSAPVAPAAAPAPAATGGGADSVDDKVAPLGGVVLEVAVKAGDAVKTGDKVVVIEAMKMKTVVSAHKDGTVSNVAVKVDDAVDAGQVLLSIT